ncbi:MAG: helix-turn-helix transcriptional regulator [Filifactor alocis]|nr:helix-turn-helix transcriptional regulator [Filifactor alocis]
MVNLEFIKKRRVEKNISQQKMAEMLGFKNASTYLKYESGEYAFKAEMLPELSRILKTDIKNFFTK